MDGENSWIPFTGAGSERATLEKLIAWSRFDEETVLRLIEMPFMETVEHTDDEAVRHLLELARTNPDGVQSVLSNPRISSGITDELAIYVPILYLEQVNPKLSARIDELPWVEDGITYVPPRNWGNVNREPSEWETRNVLYLVDNGLRAPDFLIGITTKSWVRDGLSNLESNVFFRLNDLTYRHPREAVDLLNMPFMDTVEWDDLKTLQTLVRLAGQSGVSLSEFLASPALSGGITDQNLPVVDLLEVKVRYPDKGAAMQTLPWVQDGVNVSESAGISALAHAALNTDGVFSALVTKAWVRDGLAEEEALAVLRLVSMSGVDDREGADLTMQIVNMPFLDTFEPADSGVVLSLSILSWGGDRTFLRQILDHPSLNAGITDKDALIVAVLHPVIRTWPGGVDAILETFLDPGQVYRQERTINLPLAGETALAVIRVPPAAFRTLDILEDVVRQQEGFMNAAFPTSLVAIINTNVGTGGAFDGLIALDFRDEEDVQKIAREVSDIYWLAGPTWLGDGAAEFMSELAVDGLGGVPSSPGDTACSVSNSIGELDQLAYFPQTREITDRLPGCMTNLGLGLYADLFNRLGDEEFRRGFGSLYQKMRDREHDNECAGIETGLCYMQKAFVEDASHGFVDTAGGVIDRWYYGESQ